MYEYKEEESEHTLWMGLIIYYEEKERERGEEEECKKEQCDNVQINGYEVKGITHSQSKSKFTRAKTKIIIINSDFTNFTQMLVITVVTC